MRCVVLALLACACGRVAFESRTDGDMTTGDGAVDVADGSAAVQRAYIKASNADALDRFGAAVALSADGKTLAVGAPGEASASDQGNNSAFMAGAVYVFVLDNGSWHQQAYVKPVVPDAGDAFGWSVALSADGNTLAVGAPGEDGGGLGTIADPQNNSVSDAGAAYVFTRSGTTWTQQAYLKATNTGAGDQLGYAIALSGDGATLAVGAPTEASAATGINGNGADDSAPMAGAAYVYTRSGQSWMAQAYIKASNTDAKDLFGGALALSADGKTLAIGASAEDSAAANNPSDNSNGESGAAYVYTSNGTWMQSTFLKAQPAVGGDFCGLAIALAPDASFLVVSAPGEDTTLNSGAAFVFAHSGTTWTQEAMLKGTPRSSDDQLGTAIAVSGSSVLVGAMLADDATVDNGGAAYVFTRTGNWPQLSAYSPTPVDPDDNFGESVAIGGTTLAIGASREDSNARGIDGNAANNEATDSGAVYVVY